MSSMRTLSVTDARADFSRVVESAATKSERFEVTRNGVRVAVLLGADDYDSLLETVALLADPETMASVAAGLQDLRAGDTVSADAVLTALASRRLPPAEAPSRPRPPTS
jgi:antitoxin YefM